MQVLLFVGGIGLVVLIGWLAVQIWPEQDLPEGWLRLTPMEDVMALIEVDGAMWAGGRDGVVVLDLRDGSVMREVEADAPLDYVTDIVRSERDGSLWVSHMRGVSRFDGERWVTLTEAEGLTAGRAMALLEASDGSLWVGTEQGVARCEGMVCRRFTAGDGLMTEGCALLFGDSDGRIWCGNGDAPEAGVSVWNGERWQAMEQQDRLVHPMLNAMLEDDRRALWFGTGFSAEGGVSIYDGQTWRTLTEEDGLAGGKVRYLFQDAAGVIWVGSEYNGIARLGPDAWQVFTPDGGLAGWEVMAMLHDSQGALWLGTELGLTRISREAWLALG
jgi:ligand-binding sensor domain-containing protein